MLHARRLSPFALLALLGASAVACVSATPGWTYTPAPSITPGPSVVASGSPVPSTGPAAGTVEISALGIAFEQATVDAPAGTAFQITFDNKDPGIPHNVAIHKEDPGGAEVFKGDIVTGPATATYEVPALDAGSYAFVCTVHPNMTGTLTAG
jgi:plastocyanin